MNEEIVIKTDNHLNSPRFINRFISVAIDAFLTVILTIIISFISITVFSNGSFYQSLSRNMRNEAYVCYDMNEESHLVTYNGGEGEKHYESQIELASKFKNTLYSHILLSFNTDNTYFTSKGITSLSVPEDIKPATRETDELMYFYYSFVKNKNDEYHLLDLEAKTYQQYYYDLFKLYEAKDNENSLWNINTVEDFPVLKGEYAYGAYIYLIGDNIKSEYEIIYVKLNNQYIKMWNDEYKILSSSPTYVNHYKNYENIYKECAAYIDLLYVLSFVLAFLLAYLLPTLIPKLGRTIGKKAEYICIVSNNGEKAKKYQIIFRCLLKMFSYFGFASVGFLFISLFNSTWTYTLFNIGGLQVSMSTFNVAFLILAVISLIVTFIDKDHRSIADFITRTKLIDYKIYKQSLTPKKLISDEINKDNKEDFIVIDSATIKEKEDEKK